MMSLPPLLKPHQPIRHQFRRASTKHGHLLPYSTRYVLRFNHYLFHASLLCGSYPNAYVPSLQNGPEFRVSQLRAIGDCLVFEENAFEDSFLDESVSTSTSLNSDVRASNRKTRISKNKNFNNRSTIEVTTENLVPDGWEDAVAEINLTKKERRKMFREIQFNSRVEKKKQAYLPLPILDLEESKTYQEAKSSDHKLPDLLPSSPSKENYTTERVPGKDPRWAVYGKGLDNIKQFFEKQTNPREKAKETRKLFTPEEKALLNKKLPDLASASSRKWIPLHAFASSGDSALVSLCSKQNADFSCVDADGLTALHKAILSKREAMVRYLLKESANPFVRDKDGATLMHYAVRTASVSSIKLLFLYNVDVNLQDKDGWTPLHLAVQSRRTDIVKLLLIRGADVSLRNWEGLTALDLCLYSGRDREIFELIKFMKQIPQRKLLSKKKLQR